MYNTFKVGGGTSPVDRLTAAFQPIQHMLGDSDVSVTRISRGAATQGDNKTAHVRGMPDTKLHERRNRAAAECKLTPY